MLPLQGPPKVLVFVHFRVFATAVRCQILCNQRSARPYR